MSAVAEKVAPVKDAKAAKTKTTQGVTLSSVYARHAAKRDIDTTRAAKLIRAKMRANFADVCKLSPNVTKHKKSANDGNRWPTVVTKKLAEYLLS